MNGDTIVWFTLILTIIICDWLAIHLYQTKKIPLWVSAIGMALLVPVIVGSFMFLMLKLIENDPTDDGTGVAFAGGFMVLFLAAHAILIFIIGVIVNIFTFVRNKLKVKKGAI